MTYALVSKRRAIPPDTGWEPDFPRDTLFLLLADTRGSQCGIYKFTLPEAFEDSWRPKSYLPEELRVLLDSAQRWPPAMALARDAVDRELRDATVDGDMLIHSLTKSLERGLSVANEGAFRLRRNRKEELAYREVGDWLWVRDHPGRPDRLQWVSDDFFLYDGDRGDFEPLQQEKFRTTTKQYVAPDGPGPPCDTAGFR